MAQSEDTFEIRDKVAVFTTYESYLDSLVGESDRAFLDDDDLARGLVALGLRGSGDVLSREEFDARKKADRDRHLHKDVLPKPLAAMGKDLTGKVLLAALAAREPLVRNGKLTVIVYIRDYNSKGQEVSGYIDLAHRCGRRAGQRKTAARHGSGRVVLVNRKGASRHRPIQRGPCRLVPVRLCAATTGSSFEPQVANGGFRVLLRRVKKGEARVHMYVGVDLRERPQTWRSAAVDGADGRLRAISSYPRLAALAEAVRPGLLQLCDTSEC
jgi:hypothetical protein